MSPYKIQVTQPLNEDHTQRRSEFAQLMLEKLQIGEIDVKKIWFSDEAYFTLDGHLNKQNYLYRGRERLEITVVRSLHPKKFLVWCAISSHGVFGPIFIDGTLSAENYRKFLDEEFLFFMVMTWSKTSPTNLPELKTAITTAVDTIDSEASSRVMVGFQNRLTAVLVKDGGHFEPFYH
ncbi:t-complex protein 1 subunit delta [Nephila pilipes]|uniref:T-complex protein 1 subunit delta n=1 Tax=Nephila pilipes TaxID=299642 RepID=A0A8X6U4F0_NEPPI|nr:t-complex protein 1 subunit delta [Nephila pilipes]